MFKKRAAIISWVVLPLLAACAGNPENSVLRPPAYAVPVGVDNYEVRCGSTRVFVSYDAIDTFFKDDGTAKTQEEFCQENRSDTLIRP